MKPIKTTITIEMQHVEGPKVDEDVALEALTEEIEGMDLWIDDTSFSLEVKID